MRPNIDFNVLDPDGPLPATFGPGSAAVAVARACVRRAGVGVGQGVGSLPIGNRYQKPKPPEAMLEVT